MKFLANLNTAAGLTAGIAWVRTTGKKFDATVHEIAVACLVHAKDHGDCTFALKLYNAMPKSGKRVALIKWFDRYSPIAVNPKDNKVGLRKVDAKAYMPFDIDGARAIPFFDMDKKNEDNELAALLGVGDFNDKVIKLADYFEGRVKAGKVKDEDKATVLAKVKAIRQALSADKRPAAPAN